jgi:sRNA-binding regulator protein Hfq
MVNRKLIRPNLAEVKQRFSSQPRAAATAREVHGNGTASHRRSAPAEVTNAEAFYYLKQMNGQNTMVVVLQDGEELRGHIEWYDRGCIKVHRDGAPNLLIYKHTIRYLYKYEEDNA